MSKMTCTVCHRTYESRAFSYDHKCPYCHSRGVESTMRPASQGEDGLFPSIKLMNSVLSSDDSTSRSDSASFSGDGGSFGGAGASGSWDNGSSDSGSSSDYGSSSGGDQ